MVTGAQGPNWTLHLYHGPTDSFHILIFLPPEMTLQPWFDSKEVELAAIFDHV